MQFALCLFVSACAALASTAPRLRPHNARARSAAMVVSASHPAVASVGRPIDAEEAFEWAIRRCNARLAGQRVSLLQDGVPEALERVFEHDFECLQCARSAVNVTCLCPSAPGKGAQLVGTRLLEFQESGTRRGRQCRDGACAASCSRVVLDHFVHPDECDSLTRGADALLATEPEAVDVEATLDLDECAAGGDARTALTFLRLTERVRRAIAHEYGLPLERLRMASAFLSRISDKISPIDSGYGVIHVDESSCAAFHYSGVLYLSTQGDEFEAGGFVFTDPTPTANLDGARIEQRAGRSLQRLSPRRGRLVLFSSGWENAHYVERVSRGTRYALPAFFTATAPSDEPVQPATSLATDLCVMWDAADDADPRDETRELLIEK